MKKLLVILCLVLLAGCVTNAQIVLARSQIYVGMKIMDIWKLYGFLPGDVNKVSELIPQFVNQPLSEQENNECETSIYRYWLTQNGSKLPFLLTFQSCRLPNYDTVQKEKERFTNDPNFKKELDAFCEENKVDSKNKEVLIEVLINNYYSTNGQPLLPRCMTEGTLIAIKLDKNYKGAKKSGGVAFGSKPKDFHVLEITETGGVIIDAGNNIAKPKMKFDIFKAGEIEIPVARILITQTTPTYSIGTILSRMDGSGSKPNSSDISKGMLCRETTKATLKAEKEIYKNQKKALKQQKQKSFNIQDLKLGMQKYEVEKICKGSLEFIATQAIPDSNGCSKAVYRMWPNEIINLFGQRISDTALFRGNKDRQPYQLAFVIYPPCTKELITKYIKQKNITDPNEIATFERLEGYQYSQLISVSQDMEMIKLQAIQQAQQAQQRQQNLQIQQMNQTNQNLEQIRMQNFQRQSQEDFYRMQRNR